MLRNERIVEDLKTLGYDAEMYQAYKNNTCYEGIVIRSEDMGISPIIYDADSAEDALEKHLLYSSLMPTPECDFTREGVLSSVRLGVYRADWNEQLFEDVAGLPIEGTDLRLYFWCSAGEGFRFKVSSYLMESLGLNAEELLTTGKEHEKFCARDLTDILGLPDVRFPMKVLSNADSNYGASVLCDIDILTDVLKEFGTNRMYVLPSSVHEVLCVPTYGCSEGLDDIICEINQMLVRDTEQLSDHCYIFEDGSLRNG